MLGATCMSGRGRVPILSRPLCRDAVLPVLITLFVAGCTRGCALAAPGPVAQILAPDSGSKIRQGQTEGVTIRVDGSLQVSWTLSLQSSGSAASVLASGGGVVPGSTVAQVNADALVPGTSYSLTLTAVDGNGTASAVVTFSIPDPQYRLIPLDAGNLSHVGSYTYNVDASGNQVLYSPASGDPAPITVIHRQTGQRDVLLLPLGSSTGPKFSGDGNRLFYKGSFRQGGFTALGLGYRDLGSGADVLLVDQSVNFFFTVDDSGRRVAYQAAALPDRTTQYFLYDQTTNTARQLTSDPAAIDFLSDCTAQVGTLSMITADGGTVVTITSATLGIVPADPAIGCRIFAYDVAAQSLRQVATLPASLRHVSPALSNDGRWLSFSVSAPWGATGSRTIPALVDMRAGTVAAPLIDVRPYTTFDAAVTPDGKGMIISTEADVDPRVGNSDHNMDLFYYDLATQQFTQISETLLGIGSTPNKCPYYMPGISHDGGVVVFAFNLASFEECHVDGPQRNEADGFAFNFVRAVRKRPGNNGPVFAGPPNQRVVAGDTLTLNMTTHDPDGDPISFFAQEKGGLDVFPGSTITDHYDGTATFQWPTGPQDVGDHVLRVAAFDEDGGEVFHDITISIVPSAAACAGDCNGDDQVTIDELLSEVNIALGTAALTTCPRADADSDGTVTIDDVLAAVSNALSGCPQATVVQGAVASRRAE